MNKYERMCKEAGRQRISRKRAIRLKCLDCCSFQVKEVTLCTATDCPLWRYRSGKEEKDKLYYEYHNQMDNGNV